MSTLKGGETTKTFLVGNKDKDTITQKNGVIYRYKCDKVDYDEEYTNESARTF